LFHSEDIRVSIAMSL